MSNCLHDRQRAGCPDCERIERDQRTAAMIVLGLDAEDVEIAHRAHELRAVMRANRIDASGAGFVLADKSARRVLEIVARMRRVAHADRGACDHRTVIDRLSAQRRLVDGIARAHSQRAQTPDAATRAHHEECAATWAAEASVTSDVLELLAHESSIDDGSKGDQA